jgi:hypothetical protein
MTALGLRAAGRLGLSPRRPGSIREFSPSTLPGLAFWYDAADSPVIEAGGVIQRWDDLSGNANHAAQPAPGQRPLKTTAGGRDVIRFDGIDDALLVAAPPSFAGGVTLFAVFAMRTRVDFAGIVSVAAATGVDHANFFTLQNASAASGLFRWLGRSTEANTLLIQRPDPGAPVLAILTAAGGTATYRDLSAEVADPYGGSFAAPAQIVLGGRYNGATFGYSPVNFYEIGVYSRALTGAERDQIAAYLTERYGL